MKNNKKTRIIPKKNIDLKKSFLVNFERGGFLIKIKSKIIIQNKNNIIQPKIIEYRKSISIK